MPGLSCLASCWRLSKLTDDDGKSVFFRSKFSICWNLSIFSKCDSSWHHIIYCNFCKRVEITPDRKKIILLLRLYIHTIILGFTSYARSFSIISVSRKGVAFSSWWVAPWLRRSDDFSGYIANRSIICIWGEVHFLFIFCSFRNIWNTCRLSFRVLWFSDGLNRRYSDLRNLKIIDWCIAAVA